MEAGEESQESQRHKRVCLEKSWLVEWSQRTSLSQRKQSLAESAELWLLSNSHAFEFEGSRCVGLVLLFKF